jgi:hypothetical protein
MKNLKPTIGSLIEELRLRIDQLSFIKDEDFLLATEKLAKWVFARTELEDSINFIDKNLIHQIAVILIQKQKTN